MYMNPRGSHFGIAYAAVWMYIKFNVRCMHTFKECTDMVVLYFMCIHHPCTCIFCMHVRLYERILEIKTENLRMDLSCWVWMYKDRQTCEYASISTRISPSDIFILSLKRNWKSKRISLKQASRMTMHTKCVSTTLFQPCSLFNSIKIRDYDMIYMHFRD